NQFLQNLRAGSLRIPALALRPGLSFPQLREYLRQLSAPQRQAVSDGLQFKLQRGMATPSPRRVDGIDLRKAGESARLRGLPAYPEAVLLVHAGRDRLGRRHWLQPVASRALTRLREAARGDGVDLELVSSFRSVRDQRRILARKLRQGQSLEEILRVNAPPGYSEHHSGCAIDFAVPGEPLLTESFEDSAGFAWLVRNGSRFGFALSYPRDNRWGFIYEPWHWCYRGDLARPSQHQPFS
ncbi:MAG TPA: M15 family metallopeptidase, partial [Xanthomonadales bacterium]|nr:M15 family metallopeptidase [Xanthomonadales bacterium]